MLGGRAADGRSWIRTSLARLLSTSLTRFLLRPRPSSSLLLLLVVAVGRVQGLGQVARCCCCSSSWSAASMASAKGRLVRTRLRTWLGCWRPPSLAGKVPDSVPGSAGEDGARLLRTCRAG